MKSLKTIVENIMSCNYKCEEGDLSQNPDFHALMSLAGIPIHYVIERSATQYMPPAPSKRELLIEFAKAYIEDLKVNDKSVFGSWEYVRVSPIRTLNCNAQYIVNRKKRTVVCLLRGFHSGEIYERGIAKCNPEDCFNEHIGKAIALSRALGKETPIDFLSAPQPTSAGNGDILQIDGEEVIIGEEGYTICNDSEIKIIDDSARY